MNVTNLINKVKYHGKNPQILTNDETIEFIRDRSYSISRFGDGEFNIILGSNGLKFQELDGNLAIRLEEILKSNPSKMLIGIPRIFSEDELDGRTDASKKWWRDYLEKTRYKWYKYLNFNQTYGASTFTRQYIAVEDKVSAGKYFKKIKSIWENRDVVIVEGVLTRLGVGNDLLENAKSVKRIIAPSENAFSSYGKILDASKKYSKESLFLLALGPTATVLAYDLHKLGYQAIDIGHIDVEYEWFLMGSTEKTKLANKYVNEAVDGEKISEDFHDVIYESQIIDDLTL